MAEKRIVIVDDDRELLDEIAEVLTCVGYETVTISDSGDAANAVREIMPDIVLLDLQMPAKDGFTVALELAKMPETSRIPVIGMTGFFDGPLWASMMSICGFDACLAKPIEPHKLFTQIEEAIGDRDNAEAGERQRCMPWRQSDARRADGE